MLAWNPFLASLTFGCRVDCKIHVNSHLSDGNIAIFYSSVSRGSYCTATRNERGPPCLSFCQLWACFHLHEKTRGIYFYLWYCKFLIEHEELISALNGEKKFNPKFVLMISYSHYLIQNNRHAEFSACVK